MFQKNHDKLSNNSNYALKTYQKMNFSYMQEQIAIDKGFKKFSSIFNLNSLLY